MYLIAGLIIKVIDQRIGKAKKMLFHPNGNVLISAYDTDRTIRLWDLAAYPKTKIELSFNEEVGKNSIVDFCYSSNLKKIILLFSNRSIASFDLINKDSLLFYVNEQALLIACNPSDNNFSYSTKDNEIITIDISTGNVLKNFKGHSVDIDILRYSPSGSFLASYASVSETDFIFSKNTKDQQAKQEGVFIWETESGDLVKDFKHKSEIKDLAFHPTKNELATVSENGLIKTWSLLTGKALKNFETRKVSNGILEKNLYSSLTYTKEGKFIVSGSSENLIEVWNSENGALLKSMDGKKSILSPVNVSLSKDGALFSVSSNGEAKLWDMKSGRVKKIFMVAGYPGIKKVNMYSEKKKMTTIQSNTIIFWDFTSPIYRLLYDFKPKDVANGLKFLWDIESEKLGYKERYSAFTSNSVFNEFNAVMGETQKYQSLLGMPVLGETKLDQLVRWLEERKAYRKNPAGMPSN